MSIARGRFCQIALSKIGNTVLWAQRGPDVFDCSGLVAWALRGVGGLDRRATHNAQMMADETPDLRTAIGPLEPLPGDLCFYGRDAAHVIHVAIWLAGDKVLSADGATSRVLDLKSALANPTARVRLHDSPKFRRDFLGTHRNRYLDDLELITR